MRACMVCEEWRRVKEAVLVVKESVRSVVKRRQKEKMESFRTELHAKLIKPMLSTVIPVCQYVIINMPLN